MNQGSRTSAQWYLISVLALTVGGCIGDPKPAAPATPHAQMATAPPLEPVLPDDEP